MAYKMQGFPKHEGTTDGALKAKAKTYQEAYSDNLKYKDLDKEGDYTKVDKHGREYGGKLGDAGYTPGDGEKDFTTAAKAWNMKTYGTHNPTAEYKKLGLNSKAELAKAHKAKSSTKPDTKPDTKPKKYGDRTGSEMRSDIREERQSLKDGGATRSEIRDFNQEQRDRKKDLKVPRSERKK